MYMDEKMEMRQQDLVVVCVCDGYDNIPASFKKFATEKGFYDEQVLIDGGFMVKNRDGKSTMKTMDELMDKSVPSDKIPKNILHLF